MYHTEANIDQSSKAFIQDIVLSLFDEGVIAVVPTVTSANILTTKSFDVHSLRTAKITQWYPKHVRVNLYNEEKGIHEDVTLPKEVVAIIENPLYAIMNERNSTLQRLIRKLNLLDVVDEQSGSGKLDIIIQLPYTIKSEQQQEKADARLKSIETQLAGSKYGIAYADSTERITQLNRASENNLMAQVQYLTTMLFNQLGVSEEVFKGTASEAQMQIYHNSALIPVVSAITDAFKRSFLTKTARTQGQTVMAFSDPFKLITISGLSMLVDPLSRNEIMSSNEFRSILGLLPSEDPRADELSNKNMPGANGETVNAGNVGEDGTEADTNASSNMTPEQIMALVNQNGTNSGGGITTEQMTSIIDELINGIESDVDDILGDDNADTEDNA